MRYLRFRFSNIRFKLFILSFALLCQKDFISFFFYNEIQVSNCLLFLCLTDKTQVNPQISLINVPALNYLLKSQIFVNNDGKLRAAHLILDYEPLLRSFRRRQRY